ncbi:AraC family transcriptional regulator [Pseudonocardia sp. MH-G8]|uniref:AraC family transcriptional regulator n=1 Tax=Pseudonocardia sp. MH-G8 TaxID=1854588 RepID=UPI000B9FFC33|nr:AraC family transcriptional regulator [Pseudonocardia sp. MH-G8]OZM80932.1 AraC family transcriptional regulator [Pseudonocardia sp. MH-G8]
MDLVSEVIRTVRVGSANGRLIRQSSSEGLRLPAISGAGFHVVVRGTCWLIKEGEEPVALEPGDVVLSSSGGEHGLSHVPRALDDLPPVVMGPLPPTPEPVAFEFLTCCYVLERGCVPQYLRALPDLIVVSMDYERHPEMRTLVDLLGANVSDTVMGTGVTLPALLDLILVHVLRRWHEQGGEQGWPSIDDPTIAAALRKIHEDPRRRWTVGGLSEAVGMSRTAFTRRFTAVVGQSPMSYVISWRLGLAARLLRATGAPLATIAREVGYSTEFAFSDAFRREYGLPPGRFRRESAAEGGTTERRPAS